MSINVNPDNHSHRCKRMRKIVCTLPDDAKRVFTRDPHQHDDLPDPSVKTYATAGRFHYLHTHKREMYVPCGHCVECRKRKSNEWNARLQYEWEFFKNDPENPNPCRWFITLTYAPFAEVKHKSGSSLAEKLSYKDIQNFLKRLRNPSKFFPSGLKFRFFVVGEHGDRSGRFHYHILLFLCDGSQIPDYITTNDFGVFEPFRDYFFSFMNGDTGRPELSRHTYMAKQHGTRVKRLTTGQESTFSFLLKNFFWHVGGAEFDRKRSAYMRCTRGDNQTLAFLQAKADLSLGNVQAMLVRGDTINGYLCKYLVKSRDDDPVEFESFHRQSVRLGEAYFFQQYVKPVLPDSSITPKSWRIDHCVITDLFYVVPSTIRMDARGTYKAVTPRWWVRKYSNDYARVEQFNAIYPQFMYEIDHDTSQELSDSSEAYAQVLSEVSQYLHSITPNNNFENEN